MFARPEGFCKRQETGHLVCDTVTGWVRLVFVIIRITLFNILKLVTVTVDFGPSGVRALPVAAVANEGGHYFW